MPRPDECANCSKWTADLVLAHLLALQEANDQKYNERFLSLEKVISEALESQEKATIERDKKFITRDELLIVKERLDIQDGSSRGRKELWGWIVAAVLGLIAAIPSLKDILPK